MKKITLALALASIFTLTLIDANAQRFGKTPQDSIECLMNNSLYKEFYKQKAYKDAYEPWKKVLELCPMYHVNTYKQGYNILVNLYNQATPTEKETYFNDMLNMFDKWGEFDGEVWNATARKAQWYEQCKPNEKEKIYNLYKQAKELADKNNALLDQAFCVLYLKATITYLSSIKASSEQMGDLFDVYDYASDAMEKSLTQSSNELDEATQKNDEKAMAKLQKEVDNTRSNINALEMLIEPYASCSKIVPIYEDRFKANPNDLALLKKITTNMERKGCTGEELFLNATENLHKLEPTPKTASLMGQMLIGKGQYAEAIKYLKESEETSPEISVKTKSALALANALLKTKEYSAAREAARRAVSYDKSYAGRASVLIASMYLATPGREAAWAAYDEAARAKALDPAVASDAQKVMNAAHGRFPLKQDIFFEGKTVGSSVGVGGWIGGSTTIRTRD
ncbi:MAG: tetratricopeptide repeat protein [Bacteroidales bacterium]|nr:tetratricopeptide repeat protein [Bacteroidales bacterium]